VKPKKVKISVFLAPWVMTSGNCSFARSMSKTFSRISVQSMRRNRKTTMPTKRR
jgi:hypothetical protein